MRPRGRAVALRRAAPWAVRSSRTSPGTSIRASTTPSTGPRAGPPRRAPSTASPTTSCASPPRSGRASAVQPPRWSGPARRRLRVSPPKVPKPPPTDGLALLDELRHALTTYVVLPNDKATDAVTLRIAATHSLPAFVHAPRFAIASPTKQCGKSRLLDIVAGTCHRPLMSVNGRSPPSSQHRRRATKPTPDSAARRWQRTTRTSGRCSPPVTSEGVPRSDASVRSRRPPSSRRSPWRRWRGSATCRTPSPTARSTSRCAADARTSGWRSSGSVGTAQSSVLLPVCPREQPDASRCPRRNLLVLWSARRDGELLLSGAPKVPERD